MVKMSYEQLDLCPEKLQEEYDKPGYFNLAEKYHSMLRGV